MPEIQLSPRFAGSGSLEGGVRTVKEARAPGEFQHSRLGSRGPGAGTLPLLPGCVLGRLLRQAWLSTNDPLGEPLLSNFGLVHSPQYISECKCMLCMLFLKKKTHKTSNTLTWVFLFFLFCCIYPINDNVAFLEQP